MSKKQNLADLIVMHADVLAKFIEAGFPITIGGTITLLPQVADKAPETIRVEMPEPASERPVPTSDDPAAPFGRDSKGRAIAPYGLKADGNPKRSPAGRPPAAAAPAEPESSEDEPESLDLSGDELEITLEDEPAAPPPAAAKPAQKSAPKSAPKPAAAAPVKSAKRDEIDDLLSDL